VNVPGSYPVHYTVSDCVNSVTVDRTVTVNKAVLTVTANNASRPYGVANPAFTASYSGFQNGETLATSGVTGSPSLTTVATPTSAVGNYTITAALGTLAAANYTFVFVDGTLTVDPAALDITADDDSKNYGQTKTYGPDRHFTPMVYRTVRPLGRC
jgi:hypothetical protein